MHRIFLIQCVIMCKYFFGKANKTHIVAQALGILRKARGILFGVKMQEPMTDKFHE